MGINFDSSPISSNDSRIWDNNTLGFDPAPITLALNMNKHKGKHRVYLSKVYHKYILSEYKTWDIFKFGPDLFLRFSPSEKRKIGCSSNRPYILIPYGIVREGITSILATLVENTEETLLYKIIEIKEANE